MRSNLQRLAALLALLGMLGLPAVASGAPTLPPIAPAKVTASVANPAYDASTQQALQLQQQIADAQGEEVAVENRIAATSQMITDQQDQLDQADEQLKTAQDAFDARIVAMYEFSGFDSLAVLLDSHSLDDFAIRMNALSKIVEADQSTLADARVVSEQADYEAAQLESLRAQQVTLRDLKAQQEQQLKSALAQQETVLATLSRTDRVVVTESQKQYASTRAKWRAASIPIGTPIAKVAGRVLPYTSLTYLVSQYHYKTYRTTGVKYNAVCSWYGADFNGKGTSSGEIYNMEDFTCASKTLPFGTWLALTRYDAGSRTYRRIVVVVNDRGPFVAGRDLDLSKAAAYALGMAGAGVAKVSVEEVTPVIG
jgi:rare lipoprotein A (peptidoglycan hydrolase)